MYHLHLSRNLRSLAFLVVLGALVAAAFSLWWANRTGLPESWRAAIEAEISKQGVEVRIGALSYIPLRGVVASDVSFYSNSLRLNEISRLERVLLDFDKTKLARGVVRITKIELRDADLVLPVDPEAPDSGVLEISGAYGTLLMPGGRRLEIRGARGRIAGIDLTLDARLTGEQSSRDKQGEARTVGKRRRLAAAIIDEIQKWKFSPEAPPKLRISIEGRSADSSSTMAKFSLQVPYLERNNHSVEEIRIDGEIAGDLLTVTSLGARDSRGSLSGRIDYDFGDRDGRFDLSSSLEVTPLLKEWAGISLPAPIMLSGRQQVTAEGEFRIGEDKKTHVRTTGAASLDSVMIKGVRFDSVETAFSWRDGGLFLKDIRLARPEGRADGKAMIQWPLVRLALHSTMPAEIYKPFFIGQPLEKVIDSFTKRKGAEFDVAIEGGFDATDRFSWAYTGGGTVRNVNYRGVPVDSATCRFSLSHRELDFFNGKVVFNYQDYPLRRAFNGPTSGTANVGRIRYDGPQKLVEVENVEGTFWVAPLIRLFAPKVADPIEAYRFHAPPAVSGTGVVDVTPRGRTRLDVSFSSSKPADYQFLGENLTLSSPSGKILLRGPRVSIRDLNTGAFGGPVAGTFDFKEDKTLSGELSWTNLSLTDLASTYGFKTKGGGTITGRIDFALTPGKVASMSGEGLFALDKTELFSVPMFGPLSPLVAGVLNDRRAGFERAKTAFCTFQIKDGVLSTRDFQTSTTSLTFVGDGEVDLDKRTLDMTMRMNARGLLGLITLPLRPFYGMFQFRGTGPLKDPKWENVMFTAPPDDQDQLLRTIPKATIVSPPR